jgi:cold-inducible RNA-binding protein
MSKLFVGNIPWVLNNQDLVEIFSKFGKVVDCKILTDKYTGNSRGYGFVSFDNNDSAQNALSLNGTIIENRELRVDIAQSKPNYNQNNNYN